jgi:hypothetical protein
MLSRTIVITGTTISIGIVRPLLKAGLVVRAYRPTEVGEVMVPFHTHYNQQEESSPSALETNTGRDIYSQLLVGPTELSRTCE